ncbi:TIGR04222 domain-containing membrane protein [Streptomyces sp. S.PNR 29]|uniref:TIGR04222 domain-containing membrane protein n=1 Tax=Streptomyces sp. S.PNR 29 TaxID=2973805 RepID=UPI0025B1AACD|nr:TIGR04222 domain-containing membrane protein [Streptomyces sp. S.PNR 29]MDN0197062.1 TIGR04222 domain-containing membrane protein [Streptomyces sp. S.PNR 29]
MVWFVALAVLYLLTGVAAVRFRRAYRRFADAPVTRRPQHEELSLYEVAFLHGQGLRVAWTALAAMMLGGRLTANREVVTLTDPVPRDAVEADVIEVIGLAPRRQAWECLHPLSTSPSVDAIGDRLADQGLVGSPTRCRAAASALGFLQGMLLCTVTFALVAGVLAAVGDREALIALAATVPMATGGFLAHRHPEKWDPGVTEAGRRASVPRRDRYGEPLVPPTNDDLSSYELSLLREVVFKGVLTGRLSPLADATRPPPSETLDDPPGLGGL